jgi:hypothetical protein
VCNLKEKEYKLLRGTGQNNLCIEFKNGEYKIFSMKDNYTDIVEIKINFCPLCGKKLENRGGISEI